LFRRLFTVALAKQSFLGGKMKMRAMPLHEEIEFSDRLHAWNFFAETCGGKLPRAMAGRDLECVRAPAG